MNDNQRTAFWLMAIANICAICFIMAWLWKAEIALVALAIAGIGCMVTGFDKYFNWLQPEQPEVATEIEYEQPEVAPLTPEQLAKQQKVADATKLYQMLQLACSGQMGETRAARIGYSADEYRKFSIYMQNSGVLSPATKGATPQPKMQLWQAVNMLENRFSDIFAGVEGVEREPKRDMIPVKSYGKIYNFNATSNTSSSTSSEFKKAFDEDK